MYSINLLHHFSWSDVLINQFEHNQQVCMSDCPNICNINYFIHHMLVKLCSYIYVLFQVGRIGKIKCCQRERWGNTIYL